MNTIELESSINLVKTETLEEPASIFDRLEAFIESQKDKRLGWFMVSLLAQAVLFLPIGAVLMYYYDASVWVLAASVTLFFANIIAGMGGSKMGVLLFLMALSVIAHIAMILAFVL